MRCNNCGFENAEDATHCIKCKTALDNKTAKQAPPISGTTPSAPGTTPPAPKKETTYAGTILDSQLAANLATANQTKLGEPPATIAAQGPANAGQSPALEAQTPAIEAKGALIQCPHADCGYPYSDELKVCPRCQRAPGTAAATTPVATAPPKPFAGTIDPYRTKTIIDTPAPPVCYLQPIRKDDESAPPPKLSFTIQSAIGPDRSASNPDRSAINPDRSASNPDRSAIGPNGSVIELNRDNLDPGNPSITGKTQAELIFVDGAWQLKDRSELQTTFILASAQTPLKEGDIVLLGDRKFIFSTSPAPDK